MPRSPRPAAPCDIAQNADEEDGTSELQELSPADEDLAEARSLMTKFQTYIRDADLPFGNHAHSNSVAVGKRPAKLAHS